MIYTQYLSLAAACWLAGLFLLLLGGVVLVQPVAAEQWMRRFPRSRGWGFGLLTVAAVWAWLLIRSIDLGEFAKFQTKLLIVIPIVAVLTGRFVDELLAARALGMVCLLAAEPLLEAAWLQPELGRLFLVTFAYAVIIAGMFWVGMPYLLRDHFRWLTFSRTRLRNAGLVAAAYGAVLVISGLILHR